LTDTGSRVAYIGGSDAEPNRLKHERAVSVAGLSINFMVNA
jgi:hypothetical protein